MERSELSNLINFEMGEWDPEFHAKILRGLKIDQYWSKTFSLGSDFERNENIMNTVPLLNYIKLLQEEGLDIGKGDTEFGYKMPIPPKEAYSRELQIFRRRYDLPLEESV